MKLKTLSQFLKIFEELRGKYFLDSLGDIKVNLGNSEGSSNAHLLNSYPREVSICGLDTTLIKLDVSLRETFLESSLCQECLETENGAYRWDLIFTSNGNSVDFKLANILMELEDPSLAEEHFWRALSFIDAVDLLKSSKIEKLLNSRIEDYRNGFGSARREKLIADLAWREIASFSDEEWESLLTSVKSDYATFNNLLEAAFCLPDSLTWAPAYLSPAPNADEVIEEFHETSLRLHQSTVEFLNEKSDSDILVIFTEVIASTLDSELFLLFGEVKNGLMAMILPEKFEAFVGAVYSRSANLHAKAEPSTVEEILRLHQNEGIYENLQLAADAVLTIR